MTIQDKPVCVTLMEFCLRQDIEKVRDQVRKLCCQVGIMEFRFNNGKQR